MTEIFGHLFSSYTWKVLIPLYENDTPFIFRIIDDNHPDNIGRLQMLSPLGKFPLLVDGDTAIFESSIIIEYLQQRYPGPIRFIPEEDGKALDVRTLDRFFDNYVMKPVQDIVNDFIREPAARSSAIVSDAKSLLQRSYAWLNARLQNQNRDWICGEFSLADCAAAPSLFYADWVYEIEPGFTALRDYRSRLLARPSVKRCVDDARPYRHLFPAGTPDRD